jgi:Holliday junction resolvase RusA-like endonuclease
MPSPRCPDTGVTRPECSCRPCLEALMTEHGPPRPIRLFAPGIPRPKGSKNQFGAESSKYLLGWMETVAYLARAAAGGRQLEPPYTIHRQYVFPRPKRSTWEWPTTADIDKLDRAIYDALTKAGVLLDDRHVIGGSETKRFAEPGQESGVLIEINEQAPI